MRRLIMANMVTLDGYFEGAHSWDIDWHNVGWGEELEQLGNEQLHTAGMLLFGRVTYQGMSGFWPNEKGETADLMNSISKVVFSRTLERADWNNSRLVKTEAADEIARLKQETGGPMIIFGSATLTSSLIPTGLIDEYRLWLNPILLGNGNPMFKPLAQQQVMQLIEARPLKTGLVVLRYEPKIA
jgi:dihydrofolate reductase